MFRFRFKTVAKVRKIEMDNQAKVLALAMRDVKKCEDEIESIKQRIAEEVDRLAALTHRGDFQRQLLTVSSRFRDALKFRMGEKRRELQKLMVKAEQERAKLIEKEKRKKVLDKLEEKQYEKYQEDERKADIKEMDELASSRWHAPGREPESGR